MRPKGGAGRRDEAPAGKALSGKHTKAAVAAGRWAGAQFLCSREDLPLPTWGGLPLRIAGNRTGLNLRVTLDPSSLETLRTLPTPQARPVTDTSPRPRPAAPLPSSPLTCPCHRACPAPACSLWSSPSPLSLCCQHSIQRVLLEAEPGNVPSPHQTSQGLDSRLPSEQTPGSWWCSTRPFLTLWPLQPLSCSSHVAPSGL